MLLIGFQRNPRLQNDDAVGPPLDRDIALQPFGLAKSRLGQHHGCIPTHIASPKPFFSLVFWSFADPCRYRLIYTGVERIDHAGRGEENYRGAMRIAPSSRMVSPFSIAFSTMCTARLPYSEASPSRAGCGTCAPRLLRASSFNPINSGVRNKPGAMVLTRIFWLARSRAAGNVRPTTPPLEAE